MKNDDDYLSEALLLAKKRQGRCAPNPAVGAVIVKAGRVIGRGYHHAAGMPHAEPEAIAACSESIEGATIYVSLEPCCHQGKTPPCTTAIINAGIKKVINGPFTFAPDGNPLVGPLRGIPGEIGVK